MTTFDKAMPNANTVKSRFMIPTRLPLPSLALGSLAFLFLPHRSWWKVTAVASKN